MRKKRQETKLKSISFLLISPQEQTEIGEINKR